MRLTEESGSVCYDADVEDAASVFPAVSDDRDQDRGFEGSSTSSSQASWSRHGHAHRQEHSSSASRLLSDEDAPAPSGKRVKRSPSSVRHPEIDPTLTTVLTTAEYDKEQDRRRKHHEAKDMRAFAHGSNDKSAVNKTLWEYDMSALLDTFMEARSLYVGSHGEDDDEGPPSVDEDISSVASRSTANDANQQRRSCSNSHGHTAPPKDHQTRSGDSPSSAYQWEDYLEATSKTSRLVVSPTTRSLDEVLMSFSKRPRCLVEAASPFRLVHANAAYQKLASALRASTDPSTRNESPMSSKRLASIIDLERSRCRVSSVIVSAVAPDANKAVSHYLVELLVREEAPTGTTDRPNTMVQVLG